MTAQLVSAQIYRQALRTAPQQQSNNHDHVLFQVSILQQGLRRHPEGHAAPPQEQVRQVLPTG
jgi:hypothetical protein